MQHFLFSLLPPCATRTTSPCTTPFRHHWQDTPPVCTLFPACTRAAPRVAHARGRSCSLRRWRILLAAWRSTICGDAPPRTAPAEEPLFVAPPAGRRDSPLPSHAALHGTYYGAAPLPLQCCAPRTATSAHTRRSGCLPRPLSPYHSLSLPLHSPLSLAALCRCHSLHGCAPENAKRLGYFCSITHLTGFLPFDHTSQRYGSRTTGSFSFTQDATFNFLASSLRQRRGSRPRVWFGRLLSYVRWLNARPTSPVLLHHLAYLSPTHLSVLSNDNIQACVTQTNSGLPLTSPHHYPPRLQPWASAQRTRTRAYA